MYTFSLLKNFWIEEEYSRETINRIISEHKTSYIIARLLYLVPNLEFEQVPDFLSPKMKNLMPNPNHLLDMPKAVERIYTAITKKEKITIFGDYDVDGATSSAIIHNYLKSIGVDSEIYIPDRVREGYGPNIEAMKTIAAKFLQNFNWQISTAVYRKFGVCNLKNVGVALFIFRIKGNLPNFTVKLVQFHRYTNHRLNAILHTLV
jgi:hypothetical protein